MTEALIAGPSFAERLDEDLWTWQIFVGSRRFRHAEKARVSYDKDGAGVLELEVEADLSGMARAPVRVMCGYGKADREWFTGDLARPSYDPDTGITEVEAYGVLGAMGRQYFEEPTTFQGVTLRGFFGTIRGLLYDARARIDVRSGDFSIEDTVMPSEDSLKEGAEAALEGFDHVMRERPGFGLVVAPRPRPAALGKYTAVFSRSDYPVGQPKIAQTGDGPYAKVIVHRRDESGLEVVWAEAKISNDGPAKPKPNEIYWVHDFDGDQLQAQDVASSTARALVIDGYEGELQDFSPNADLFLDEPVLFRRVERDRATGKRYRRDYASVITEAELDLIESSMSVSFDALRIRDEEIPEREIPPAISPYVIAAEGATHDTAFGVDQYGRLFFRRGTAADYAAEDAAGLYVVLGVSEFAGVDEYGRIYVEISE